ncbi:glutamate racemase [Lichenihabitans sp. PAMC28606]|uniref:glutamate racemase n=1 Tax=Lichenihabitans sp. PAMC28606 TaxID=2880932 RepID=UPI001D0BC931|nr:glutamate racemase [Lichenihabitans sp. PAMC28606]UDL95949.1 glutamate racemase [Lichenihabitans sp. PAMC28606]
MTDSDVLSAAADASGVSRGAPRVLVFDSGLGGLTVLAEIVKALPGADVVFAADDAVFPYGQMPEAALVARVVDVVGYLIDSHAPDVVVIACNTASTVVLEPLRARWPAVHVVGTVPAIKPAAAQSRSRRISVLATPGTVARDYTRDLVRSFAADCAVDLVGSVHLASLVEASMRGETLSDAAVSAEILPVFVDQGGRRTDVVVLACTHFPLLLDTMKRLAPWPVTWIDPAPAIARRVVQVLTRSESPHPSPDPQPQSSKAIPALFTSGRVPGDTLLTFLDRRGLDGRGGKAFPPHRSMATG